MTLATRVLNAKSLRLCAVAALLLLGASAATLAGDLPGLTVIGVDAAGNQTPVDAYRWLVEEDQTYHVQTLASGVADPTTFDPNWQQLSDGISGGETLSVGFHDSYTPVVAKGCVGWGDVVAANPNDSCATDLLPALGFDASKNYYVSVVPRSGYSIGGAEYVPGVGATVYVSQHPIPTAQISILIFHDNAPINNAPDLPTEDPANFLADPASATDMSGFQIIVEDAGGRYGASAGIMSQDAFGNPLGTTYDALGNVTGYAPLITDSTGRITIKNLAPGKYGIQAVPPPGSGWQQTSTIEGTKVIDAWVKANEPPFFAEFGPAGFHVFIGFVKEFNTIPAGGGATISGTVVNQHLSRPPDYAIYNGACFGHTTPWVGLNTAGGLGEAIYAGPTDGNCNFSIPNVPDGNYQIVFWDNNLDLIFAFKGISIVGGQCNTPTGCALGDVPIFQWFHRQEHFVFDDLDGDGLYDEADGETPILEQALNLRWRDGTIYQTNVTDPAGLYAFDQTFPFFSWLVAEVDFVRFEATALTVVADNGGAVPFGATEPGFGPEGDVTLGGMTNPQDQTVPADPECADPSVCTENAVYRTDYGPVLTAGFQGFIGQTHGFQWGKRHYPDVGASCEAGLIGNACTDDFECGTYCEDGTTACTIGGTECDLIGLGTCGPIVGSCVAPGTVYNGGISGIVFYAVTRAENDPELAAAEVWEPGIPGVTVNLYASGGVDPDTGVATKGVLLNTTTTDSWDDSIPTGCKYGDSPENAPFEWSPDGNTLYATDCYDGLRNFNQIRPAVFDGGYAFDAICADAGGMLPDGSCTTFTSPMPVGDYLVEVIAPDGYEILKPEDKNVDFGDEYEPAPELLPAPCVGELALIPPYLTLFPDEMIESPFAWDTGIYQPTYRPLCDTKLVTLSTGANAAADFWLFTEVPVAAQGFGFILDDTQAEFNPNSPQFGEKYAPPFMPVTIRDWTGRVIGKTLSDQYGRYNFLAPSTITTNLPMPSGMSPNMLTTCMNDPGDDPNNPDPNWNQQYSTFCYTFQYMPGVTTYLDTPVVPVAAFTGPDQFPLDCEYGDGTPRIYSVDVQTNGVGGGPYIPTMEDPAVPGNWITAGEQTITITSMGPRQVQNPEYCNPAAGACPAGADTLNKFVTRDFGFGAAGTVTLGELGTLLCTWGEPITCTVLAGTPVSDRAVANQLTVTRANGLSTVAGVTVQTGLRSGGNALVIGPPPGGATLDHTIQDAIDAAGSNDLILVRPGTYNELVVMWKPIQLQGFGEGSTTINAVKAPAEKLEVWRGLVDGLIASAKVDLVPGQEVAPGAPEPVTLWNEEGAGVLVLARAGGGDAFDQPKNLGARIDGFTIKGADTGGGIVVNGYGRYLDVSNNRISNNSGFYGGGIRVGHPELTAETDLVPGGCPDGAAICYPDAQNDHVDIHRNQVVFNGGLGGAGGGISMCTGSDAYAVTQNWVCGNFTAREGGGIGHIGVSDGVWVTQPNTGPQNQRVWKLTDIPLIQDNTVIFNEGFFQGQTVSGGGIFIGGAPALIPGELSPGAGNVLVNANLVQGNSAGAGDGGGLRLARINGQEVANNPTNTPKRNGNAGRNDPAPWYRVDVFNNMFVNNVAALAGGGLSLQDALDVRIAHNTIANNDSLAVAGEAFAPGSPNESTPQPGAGIVTRPHSPELAAAGSVGTFSDPSLFADNILWHNRQFFFFADTTSGCTPGDPGCLSTYGLCPDVTGALNCPGGGNAVVYDDLEVLGAGCLSPTWSILTDLLEDDPACSYNAGSNNLATDPMFVAEYANGARSSVVQQGFTTIIQTPAAFDEGGNFIRPVFGPLSLFDDPAANDGNPGTLFGDYHIQGASGAVNAGDNVGTASPLLNLDFDAEPRPDGTSGVVDIGADEVQP